MVWASKGNEYGFAKVNAAAADTAVIVLDKAPGFCGSFDFDIVPPPQSASLPRPTAAQTAENDRRKQYEDSVRGAYEATFATEASAAALAKRIGAAPARVEAVLIGSRGNHAVIENFLADKAVADKTLALDMLQAMSVKDLRDVSARVLYDHYSYGAPEQSQFYTRYVLNPRVENEMLTPYKHFLRQAFGNGRFATPQQLVQWVSDSIAVDNVWNPLKLRMSPQAVYEQRMADPLSRSIFFVAAARTAGFPSRIDPVTGKTQYASDENSGWTDVQFGPVAEAVAPPAGVADIRYHKSGRIDQPAYYSHFSISKIESGYPRLLEFPEFAPISEICTRRPADTRRRRLSAHHRAAPGQRCGSGTFAVLYCDSGRYCPCGHVDTAGYYCRAGAGIVQLREPLPQPCRRYRPEPAFDHRPRLLCAWPHQAQPRAFGTRAERHCHTPRGVRKPWHESDDAVRRQSRGFALRCRQISGFAIEHSIRLRH